MGEQTILYFREANHFFELLCGIKLLVVQYLSGWLQTAVLKDQRKFHWEWEKQLFKKVLAAEL